MTRLAPSSPASQLIERQFQAFLAGIIDVGEAQHVAGDFAGGVVAAVFARQIDAGNGQVAHLLAPRPAAVPRATYRNSRSQLLVTRWISSPRSSFSACARRGSCSGCRRQFLRIDPHRVDRRADRERLAVAIDDHAAMRRDGGDAREARIAFRGEEVVIDTAADRARLREQRPAPRRQQQAEAPATTRQRNEPARPVTCDPGASWRDDLDLLRRRGGSCAGVAGDVLDKGIGRPGALLELQLAPLGIELVRAVPTAAQLHEHLARAVLAPHRRRRPSPAPRTTAAAHSGQYTVVRDSFMTVSPRPAATRCARADCAASSAAVGRCLRPTRRSAAAPTAAAAAGARAPDRRSEWRA